MKKGLLIGLAVVLLSMVQSPTWGQDQELTLTELRQVLHARGARWEAGETSMNKLSHAERKARLGLTAPDRTRLESKAMSLTSASSDSPVAITPTLDWRNNGGNYVTAVKNQASCGSCWAFASTAALESAVLRYRQTPGVDLNLSEQVLVSCCGGGGNCQIGGSIEIAANYFMQTGLPPDSCYPYTGTDGSCSAACAGWQASTEKLSNWVYLGAYPSVDTIKNALNNYGPLVTAMAVYQDFFSYHTGVYHYVSGGLAGGHAVLIVGYDDVNQCFIVKNSWGTGWGEQGFFRIAYSEMSSVTQFGYDTIAYVMTTPGTCTFTLSPTSRSLSSAGGADSVSVSAAPNCAWTAASNASWISITYGLSGSGNGTVGYSVAANTTTSARNGTMTIAGQTFTVSQAATTCTYAISPASQSVNPAGGTGSVGVSSTSGCAWTASSNASWISITYGLSGSGNGTVGYSVAANTTTSARNGALTVAGQTFTVNQAAAGCTYAISPASQSVNPAGGTGSVGVSSTSGCAWTAVSNATSWLTVTSGSNGSGSGTVGYSAAANTTTSSRSGTLTVAGQTFTVNQAAAACTYAISPTSNSFTSAAGTGSVAVTSASGCAWTATSNASSWLTISSGASGTGNGTVSYSAAANTSGSSRTGTLTVGGQSFSVTQAGQSCSYNISPYSQSYTAAGGTGSANVFASSGCPWTATSSASWISVTSGASGSGSGPVSYSVTNNTGASVRQGTMTIAGSTFTVTQTGLSCDYTVTPVNQSLPGAGGTGSASVSAPSGCPWTATSTAPSWLTITSGASGSGSGTVSYTVSANTTGVRRSANMTIGGNTSSYVSIVQSALSCSYSITPVSQSYTGAAGTGSVNVISASGCPWTASSNASWISLTSGASGSGSGTVGYSVTANTTTAARSGTLTVAGQTYTVSQAAQTCTYAISPTSNSVSGDTGTGSVSVTSGSGCAWTASSNASWISITSGTSGSGNGTASYSVTANTSTTSRSGTLTIAGQTHTVSQATASCTYTISPTSQSLGSAAGTGSVNVISASGCPWTASSNASWISLTSGASSSGSGTVGYSVTANTTTAARSGTLTIAGQTYTVSQAAQTCTYAISPTSNSVSGTAGTGSVSVTSSSGCAWTAASNATWITVTSGSSGTGNGTVGYSMTANTTTASRSGTLTIAGQTYTVSQAGASCTYAISPPSQSLGSGTGTGSVSVTSSSGCAWTAVSNATSWLTVTSGSSGTGNGTVGYSATANTTTASRSGTLTIAGQTHTVSQAGASCTYAISPTSNSVSGTAGTGSVSVTSASGCAWTASTASSWITINGGQSGSGNGTVAYSVAPNPSSLSRWDVISIAGQNHTVTQAAAGCTYTITPVSQSFTATASVGSVGIACDRGCAWTATSNASWITITSNASGSRGDWVSYVTTANSGASRTGTLTVAGTTVTVTQAGNPSLSVSTTALGFGTLAKGTTLVKPVMVSNTGTSDLTVASVTVDTLGGSVTSYSQSHNCSTVKPGASCTIEVKFSPGGSGTKSTYLYIYSNGGTAKVPLTGTAQ